MRKFKVLDVNTRQVKAYIAVQDNDPDPKPLKGEVIVPDIDDKDVINSVRAISDFDIEDELIWQQARLSALSQLETAHGLNLSAKRSKIEQRIATLLGRLAGGQTNPA